MPFNRRIGIEVTLFLGGEVAVEGPARNGGGGGDLGDRRVVVAALGDRGDDAGGEAVALVSGHELAGQPMATGRQPWQAALLPIGRWLVLPHLGEVIGPERRLALPVPFISEGVWTYMSAS